MKIAAAFLGLLCCCGVPSPSDAAESRAPINCDQPWSDSAGEPIRIRRGCLIPAGGSVYWFGVDYLGSVPGGVRVYRSVDLASWEPMGAVALSAEAASVRGWFDADDGGFQIVIRKAAKLIRHTAEHVEGPYVLRDELALSGASGDGSFSIWVEDDGSRLLSYTSGSGEQRAILLAEWPRGQNATVVRHRFAPSPVDSPALWKSGDTCFVTAAAQSGPRASPVLFSSASRLDGPWSRFARVANGIQGGAMMSQKWGMRDGFDSTHNGVFGLPGKKGRLIIYCGDRWSELHGIGTGRQVWLPIEIEDGRPGISWLRPWFADVEAGEFSHQLREYGLWR